MVTFIRVVDTAVHLWEKSSKVNIEIMIHRFLTFLHIFDAEVLINLFLHEKVVMLTVQYNKHRLSFLGKIQVYFLPIII